jgi:hypothetical protein
MHLPRLLPDQEELFPKGELPMKMKACGLLAAFALATVPMAQAQENMTQGPVWTMACYQVNDGQWSNYMTWLRTHSLPLSEARKKAGLILDYKVFMTGRDGPNGCDLTFATLHASAGAAFDYSADDDVKGDAIDKAHWGQWSEEDAKKARDSRLEMRRFIRNSWAREVTLKPMP